jgi:hypothetical protein
METRFQNFPATLETGQIKKEMKRWYAARGNEEHWSTCEKDILATLSPWTILRGVRPDRSNQPEGVRTGKLPQTPFQVSRWRGGRCACRQSGIFLCVEPSFLEHNGGIVTCCFSQRYRSQAVVKRSNSKSTIEFP